MAPSVDMPLPLHRDCAAAKNGEEGTIVQEGMKKWSQTCYKEQLLMGKSRRMKDVITRQTVVDKLAAYLHHELSLSGLVAWAETSLMDGEFDGNHFSVIRDVVARVGVADVRAFGLTLR